VLEIVFYNWEIFLEVGGGRLVGLFDWNGGTVE
jgi:hypothetical protein